MLYLSLGNSAGGYVKVSSIQPNQTKPTFDLLSFGVGGGSKMVGSRKYVVQHVYARYAFKQRIILVISGRRGRHGTYKIGRA